jgi:uncharacterized protein with ATP-grasp and redox domains
MQTELECPSCLFKNFLMCADEMNFDDARKKENAKGVFRLLAEADFSEPPARYGREFWEYILEISPDGDPLKKIKRRQNALVKSIESKIEENIQKQENLFLAYLLYVIAGNSLDPLGAPDLDAAEVLESAANTTFAIDDSALLLELLKTSSKILYLTDNAGEIVVDKLFIKYLIDSGISSAEKICVVTRGGPCINDALYEDAEEAGLTELVKVTTTGDHIWGVDFDRCSDEFRNLFYDADLIISKGMANYETLHDNKDKTICLLLMSKCPPVTRSLGVAKDSFVCKVVNP